MHNFFPKDTRNLISKKLRSIYDSEYNFKLLYYMPKVSFKKDDKIEIKINKNLERYKWDYEMIEAIQNKVKNNMVKLENEGYYVKSFELTNDWRLIIGLGGSHPQESSMSLHHIYGIPYIPGTAIKGVTRQWCLMEYFNNNESSALKDNNYTEIFGTQEKAGNVVFYDALPTKKINLRMDVMTPHHSKYYSEGKVPTDMEKPIPIEFLTVENTNFAFFLSSKEEQLLNKSVTWVKEALQNYGIGAKTSVGYGYF